MYCITRNTVHSFVACIGMLEYNNSVAYILLLLITIQFLLTIILYLNTILLYWIKHICNITDTRFTLRIFTAFEPRQQYVVSLSKKLYPHCFSRLSCEMSTRWGQPRVGCSVL